MTGLDQTRPEGAPARPTAPVGALLVACALPPLVAPSGAGRADLLACLAWLTWLAWPLGLWAGARGPRPPALGAVAFGWGAAVAVAVWLGPVRQPEPSVARALCGLGPALGLLAAGVGLGLGRAAAGRPGRAARIGHVGLVALLLASGAPVAGGLAPESGSDGALAARRPAAAALLLDLSPVTLAAESAGVDWMRHPSVYGPAGTDWFSGYRRPYSGSSGIVALILGVAAGAVARRSPPTARRGPRAGPSDASP